MKIFQATEKELEAVKNIVQTTIRSVYPLYYPAGAVDFFIHHHSDENIERDIVVGDVYIICDGSEYIGTVTIHGNEIDRLFVLPEFQCRGYGKSLMEFAENIIFQRCHETILAASLPAKQIYKKPGYTETEYHVIKTENGDFLCFDMMKKEKS